MTDIELTRRVEMLESIVLSLQEKLSKSDGEKVPESGGDAFPDHLLEKPWADKTISRDPKFWDVEKNGSYVGKTFSQAPVEWLERMASLLDYKVAQEKKKEAPKLDNKGKPFYERDIFDAKLLRAWARRKRMSAAIPGLDAPGDEIPF